MTGEQAELHELPEDLGHPRDFECTISKQIMTRPVKVTSCGHTFDEASIKAEIQVRGQCPMCRSTATWSDLQEDVECRNSIKQWLKPKIKERHGEAFSRQARKELESALRQELESQLRDHIKGELCGEMRELVMKEEALVAKAKESLAKELDEDVRQTLRRSLRESVRQQQEAEVWNELFHENKACLREELAEEKKPDFRVNLQQMCKELKPEVVTELGAELREDVKKELRDAVDEFLRKLDVTPGVLCSTSASGTMTATPFAGGNTAASTDGAFFSSTGAIAPSFGGGNATSSTGGAFFRSTGAIAPSFGGGNAASSSGFEFFSSTGASGSMTATPFPGGSAASSTDGVFIDSRGASGSMTATPFARGGSSGGLPSDVLIMSRGTGRHDDTGAVISQFRSNAPSGAFFQRGTDFRGDYLTLCKNDVRWEIRNELINEKKRQWGLKLRNEIQPHVESDLKERFKEEVVQALRHDGDVFQEVKDHHLDDVWQQRLSDLHNEVWSELRSELKEELRAYSKRRVQSELHDSLEGPAEADAEKAVREEARQNLRKSYHGHVKRVLRKKLKSSVVEEFLPRLNDIVTAKIADDNDGSCGDLTDEDIKSIEGNYDDQEGE